MESLTHDQITMDIFSSTSRGKNLGLTNHTIITGGFITELVDAALCKSNLRKIDRYTGPHFIYILGGLPDTTVMLKDSRYEEVIFKDTANKKSQELISTYLDANYKIRSAGAIPVFSTITTMSINDWNSERYRQRKTSYLIHTPYYEDMQPHLNSTLDIVNSQIFVMNDVNGVETPHFAGSVRTKRGEGQGYRTRYYRLADGVHPVKEVITEWKSSLGRIVAANREMHS